MAIPDITARFVTFPDQSGVTRLLEALFRVHERRIPTPPVRSGHSDTPFQQVHGGPVSHAAARTHVVGAAVARAGTRIDEHNFERNEFMANSGEFPLYLAAR